LTQIPPAADFRALAHQLILWIQFRQQSGHDWRDVLREDSAVGQNQYFASHEIYFIVSS
jgi:hypothetical protein